MVLLAPYAYILQLSSTCQINNVSFLEHFLLTLLSRPTKGKHWRKQFEIENHTKPLGWIYSKCFSTVFGGNDLTLCHEVN